MPVRSSRFPWLAALALALACTASAARATTINDLKDAYSGPAYSTNASLDEITALVLIVNSRQPNGRFTGQLNSVAVSGKVSSRGKLTINNRIPQPGGVLRVKVQGQLSLTGKHIVGSATFKSPILGTQAILFDLGAVP